MSGKLCQGVSLRLARRAVGHFALPSVNWLRLLHATHSRTLVRSSNKSVLFCSSRHQSTSGSSTTFDAYSPEERRIIDACRWQSDNMAERLGFAAGEQFDEERLKRNFFILAKHLHPDSHTSPAGHGTEAFQKVNEAYTALRQNSSSARGASGSGEARGSSGPGFEYADENRRRGQIRLLGDGVMLFLLMTFAYIIVIARHNKERLGSRHLWDLVCIFAIVQVFPRILASALLFAWMTTYYVANTALQEQANVAVVIEKTPGKAIRVHLDGIAEKHSRDVVVQVEVRDATAVDTKDGAVAVKATTLTYDAGVTSFTLPPPPHDRVSSFSCHITAIDERRKFTVVDKTFKLSACE